ALIQRELDTLRDDNNPDLSDLRQFKLSEVNVSNPATSLSANEIQFFIETMTGDEADRLTPANEPTERGANQTRSTALQRLKGVPLINVVYHGDRESSAKAHDRMVDLLRLARRRDAEARLLEHGFSGDPKQLFSVNET